MLRVEVPHGRRIACNQRWRYELRKLHDCELLRMVAKCPRSVHYVAVLPFSLFEEVGGVDVLRVEWWVLAHEDSVKVF